MNDTHKPKHIGIVAGSAEGAALCYRTICVEGSSRSESLHHPEVTLHTFPVGEYIRFGRQDNWEQVGRLMLLSANKLASVGAEIIICPDNTLHIGLDLMIRESPGPWLHIAQEVTAVAALRGFKRLGLLGTQELTESSVYPDKLTARGIACELPELADRTGISELIMGELIQGRFEANSRGYVQGVIKRLQERGCDAIVLGCTELPLLILEGQSALPTLDSTRILARAALRETFRDAE